MSEVTFVRVLRFEWIKFRSLRSSWLTLAVAVAVFIGLGLFTTWFVFVSGADSAAALDAVTAALSGSALSVLIVGVLGVLVMTGEYSTGTIRSSLTAVPRRMPLLAAKAVVFATVVYTLMLAATVVTVVAGQRVIGAAGVSLADAGTIRAILGSTAYVTGAGLLGLFLGGVLRSTAGSLTAFFVVTFLMTLVSRLILSQGWRESAGRFLPSAAGEAMGATMQLPDALTPGQGGLVFAGYVLLAGGAAAWRMTRSDAT
ncbi:ABC transporter permease [Actinoplanes philippinensis]|uniref:ABC-2 family transporter protein n=1 Tax=Actinoplanes philippinensis TaxID=35752 RepID=A0A1I2EMX8_9ACTN|nr:ABC transporter permease subunit [Actinoplanes philippinensis]GIE82578.1 ABC transporter permease [Actinoplanes philippinensis]SFE93808.1 ABC-2 family transporter protein [Actinoplanes philippinensis]